MDGKKIDQLWHEAPEDREAPPPGWGVRGVLAPALKTVDIWMSQAAYERDMFL